jgi:hypothetical protein
MAAVSGCRRNHRSTFAYDEACNELTEYAIYQPADTGTDRFRGQIPATRSMYPGTQSNAAPGTDCYFTRTILPIAVVQWAREWSNLLHLVSPVM